MNYKTKVKDWNRKKVEEAARKISETPVIGIIDLTGLSASTAQKVRWQLRGTADIFVTKKRFLKRAIDLVKDKKNVEILKEHLVGEPALLLTKENAFKIYKRVEKSKSAAPIKAGQTAPFEIVIPAGPTPFNPGPMISEFASLGIKAGVENGKIAIKSDFVAAKEGDKVDSKTAGLLMKMGITPMEEGLNLTSVFEDGNIFLKKILSVDDKEYFNNITKAAQQAINLSVEAAYPVSATINLLLARAFTHAKAVAIEGNILAKGTVSDVLAKVVRIASEIKGEYKL